MNISDERNVDGENSFPDWFALRLSGEYCVTDVSFV